MAEAQAEVDARTERPVCRDCGNAVTDFDIANALQSILDKRPQCHDCIFGALI
jgi:hypothetical protein